MEKKASPMTKARVWLVAIVATQFHFWVTIMGPLTTFVGLPCLAVLLCLAVIFAPMRWKYPTSIAWLGENWWFRWCAILVWV